MKITTKTGDRGHTSLFGGRRVSKSSKFIEMVGSLDELQANLGLCRHGVDEESAAILEQVIDDIYRMMSIVGFEMKCPKNIEEIGEKDVEFLESSMRKYDVGELQEFVRPGSTMEAARLHVARTVCRRTERELVKQGLEGEMLKYVNRLSDLLFVMAFRLES